MCPHSSLADPTAHYTAAAPQTLPETEPEGYKFAKLIGGVGERRRNSRRPSHSRPLHLRSSEQRTHLRSTPQSTFNATTKIDDFLSLRATTSINVWRHPCYFIDGVLELQNCDFWSGKDWKDCLIATPTLVIRWLESIAFAFSPLALLHRSEAHPFLSQSGLHGNVRDR
jgi:hypothetical protein